MTVTRPTFHESWYRVRKLRPSLRTTVQTYRQHFRGRPWHVIQDSSSNMHFRVDDAGYHFVALLDGTRTIEEAWRLCNEKLGDAAPTQGEAINLLGQLYTSNLLQSDLPADAAGMFENYRKRIRREIGSYFMNALFVRIPIFDPDHVLDRWLPIFGKIFSWYGFVAWATLIAIGASSLVGRGTELVSGISGILDLENIALLYVSFAVVKAIHEFGHGFASKQFGKVSGGGGEVHVMGIMLLVFTPVPYVDASSSWAFRNKWHRAIVGAAGMYVELAVAAVAALVWANTSPGLVNSIAYNIIFVASVSTILFNGNPLLRFDGYYILSDLLEIPNLAKRSRDYLYYLVRRYAFAVKRATSPAAGTGERTWLPIYAVASTIYRVIIFAGIILFVADKFFFIGALFAIASIISWLFMPMGKFIRYLASNEELMRNRPRAAAISLAFFAAIVVLLGVVPFPDRGRAEGVVEPREVAMIFVNEDGFIRDALLSGRDVTTEGPALIVADNLKLETERRQLEAERRLTELERDRASLDEPALAQSLGEKADALTQQIARLDERLERLTILPPVDGQWVSPGIEQLEDAYARRGHPLGVVANIDDLLIRAVADQGLGPRIGAEVNLGETVDIRVKGRPDIHFEGTVEDILPAGSERLPSAALGYLGGGSTMVEMDDDTGTQAVEPVFEIHVDLAPATLADVNLLSGQRVVVRFTMPSKPLMVQWWRALRQLVQRRFQI